MTSAYTSCPYVQTLGIGEGRLRKGRDGGAAACGCLGKKLISSAANGVVAVEILKFLLFDLRQKQTLKITFSRLLLLACHAFGHAPGPIFSQIRRSFDRCVHALKLKQHL